jgi:S1-C subfamily serine protease
LLDVLPGGAAADAGLRSGDTITRFNGATISGNGDMQRELARVVPNTTVATSIWRNDHEMPVNVRF